MSESNDQTPCCGWFGLIFGHGFRPRYHKEEQGTPPPDSVMKEAINNCKTDTFLSGVIDSVGDAYRLKNSTYIGDVCVRCGMVIERME